MADSLILMVMALVVFGPRRLPQIGRQVGKLMYEFRKASNDFKFQMEEELRNAEEADRRKKEEEQRQLAAAPTAQLGTGETAAPAAPVTIEVSHIYGNTYGEVAEAQAKAEATYPSIQPPATGEPVPAAWPANETYEAEPAQEPGAATDAGAASTENQQPVPTPAATEEQTPAEKENAVIETAVEDTNRATEPAHNG